MKYALECRSCDETTIIVHGKQEPRYCPLCGSMMNRIVFRANMTIVRGKKP